MLLAEIAGDKVFHFFHLFFNQTFHYFSICFFFSSFENNNGNSWQNGNFSEKKNRYATRFDSKGIYIAEATNFLNALFELSSFAADSEKISEPIRRIEGKFFYSLDAVFFSAAVDEFFALIVLMLSANFESVFGSLFASN